MLNGRSLKNYAYSPFNTVNSVLFEVLDRSFNYTARASCTASTICRLNNLYNAKLDGTPNETFPISSMEHIRLNGFLRLCKLWFIWPLGVSALDASGVPRERDSNDT